MRVGCSYVRDWPRGVRVLLMRVCELVFGKLCLCANLICRGVRETWLDESSKVGACARIVCACCPKVFLGRGVPKDGVLKSWLPRLYEMLISTLVVVVFLSISLDI